MGIESKSSQKVLTSDGLNHLLAKIKASHIDKMGSNSEYGHVKIGPINTPTAINGEGIAAPSYHTHPAQTEITGNAGTATKLKNTVNISLTGAVTGNSSFDGSKDITINTTTNKVSQSINNKTTLSELEPGDYLESNGTVYTDTPNGVNSSNDFIINVIGSTDKKTQIFTDLVTGRTYTRTIQNDTITDWKELLSTSGNSSSINANTADKLKTARNISLSGDIDGSALFDGSEDVDIDVTLSDTGVDADTYGSNSQSNFDATGEITIPSYVVDSAGRITSSNDQIITIPKPTTNTVTIALEGDITGSKVFDGTKDLSIATTLKDSGVTAGTYGNETDKTLKADDTICIPKFTVNSKGIVTFASTTSVSLSIDAFNKVKSTPVTSGKIYLTGKSDPSESTSTDIHNSELYYDVENKVLHAGKIAATIEGVSDSANRLASPVNITLSGAVNGSHSFDGSSDINITTSIDTITDEEIDAMMAD